MFGLISKKRLEKELRHIINENRTDEAWSVNDRLYRMGNANAVNYLVYKLGLHQIISATEPIQEEEKCTTAKE